MGEQRYNVDDILAEVELRRRAAAPAPPPERQTAPPPPVAAPSGSVPLFAAREAEPAPKKPKQPAVTRMDLPSSHPTTVDDTATRVSQVTPPTLAPEYTESRQKKVREFMQEAQPRMARLVEEELEPPAALSPSIEQFFGGLHQEDTDDWEEPEELPPRRSLFGKRRHSPIEPEEEAIENEPSPFSLFGKRRTEEAPKQRLTLLEGNPSAEPELVTPPLSTEEPCEDIEERRDPIRFFARRKPREESATPLHDEDEPPQEGEYQSPADTRSVRGDILKIKQRLSVRLLLTGFFFLLLLYLALSNLFPLPLPEAIYPESDMQLFLLVNLLLLLLDALVANTVIGSGMLALFTLKADHDTPAALCTFAALAHGVALWVSGDGLTVRSGSFYFVVAALVLLVNTLGKRLMIVRIERNFAVASVDALRTGEYMLIDHPFAEELTEGQGFERPAVAYPTPVSFPTNFLRLSYSDDYSENLSRYISPIFLLFGLILSLAAYLFFDQTPLESLTIFTAVLCMAAPLTPTLIGNFPLYRAAMALSKEGAFISGYGAVEEFEEMNTVAVDACDLYPAGTVELCGIKSFVQSRIDEAILDAASLMWQVDGLMKDVFLNMIGGKTGMLKPVHAIAYEEKMGLSAIVDGKQVLVGNRTLLKAHHVATPSRDFEKKYATGDQDILYLANSGEITAMFILRYHIDEEVADRMQALERKQISLVIHATDPNITDRKVADDFGYPVEYVRIVPADLRERYLAMTAPRPQGDAYIMSLAGTAVRLRVLCAIHTLRQSIILGTILQMAGLVLGYAMVTYLAFTGGMGTLGFLPMMLYQLFWCFAVLVFPNLRRI